MRLSTDSNHIQTTPAILDLTVDLTACEHQPVAVNSSISEYNFTQHQASITVLQKDYFTLTVLHTQCDGYDYWLATDATGLTPASPTGVVLGLTDMTIDPTVPGTFDFFVIVKSKTSLLHAAKQVRINVKAYCLDQNVNATSSTPLAITMQKNKLNLTDYIYTLKTKQELLALWNTPVNATCAISSWFLSDPSSDVELAATDPTYIRF